MATKTNNLGLSKAELTDSIRSTLLANNQNFDKLDEADIKTNDRISMLRENQIVENVTGMELEINSDIETESILHLSGNSEQDSRSGKNLLNIEDGKTTNCTKSINENSITLTSTQSTGGFCAYACEFPAKPNTKYYLQSKSTRTGNGGGGIIVQVRKSDNTTSSNLINKRDVLNASGVFTTPSDTVNIRVYLYACGDTGTETATQSATFTDVQVEEGSVATSYEPYGVQPSPEFESPIRSVKSKTENLFNINGDISTKYNNTTTTTNTVSGNNLTSTNNWKTTTGGGQRIYVGVGRTVTASMKLVAVGSEYTGTENVASFAFYNENNSTRKGVGFRVSDVGTVKTLTFTAETDYIYLTFGCYTDYVASATFTDIMLNKGNKALPYQPYGYVPAELNAEGKNLLNLTDRTSTIGGNGTLSVKDGLITLNGTLSVFGEHIFESFQVGEDGDYAFSKVITATLTNTWSVLQESEDKSTWSSLITFNFLNETSSKTATLSKEKYYRIRIASDANNTFSNLSVKLQLERGVKATEWKPYVAPTTIPVPLGDIELRSTPDGTRDTFERVDGVWNKRNNVGHEIKDGSSNYLLRDDVSTADGFYTFRDRGYEKTGVFNSNCAGLSNYFEVSQKSITNKNHIRFVDSYYYGIQITIDGNIAKTPEELKAWLDTHPLDVIYPLKTPTYTPITDQALIQALDELEQLILHKGYNRITATSVNGVKAELDLTYYKSTEKEIERIETKFDKETDNLKKEADNLKEENLKLNDRVDRLYANQIQGTASGTEIVIQDGAKMESILHLNGNSEQDTRSGYNLYDYKDSVISSVRGLTSVLNKDGTITTTGTPEASWTQIVSLKYITDLLEDGQTYTVGQTVANNNHIYVQINAIKKDGSGTVNFYPRFNKKTDSFTVDKTAYSSYAILIQNGNKDNMTSPVNYTAGYMLLKGSYTDDTLPEFEPYGAQPSPEFESPIRSVKSKSDNLVKLYTNTGSVTSAGVTVTMIDYNTVKINGTATANGWLELLYDFKNGTDAKTNVAIPLDNSKYTASCFVESGSLSSTDNAGYITFAMTDGSAETQSAVNFGKSKTFNGLKGIGRIFLAVKSGITYNNFVVKVQLNKGDKALPYQPYGYAPVEVKVEGKNLLKKTNSYVTTTTNGITYTVNKDQSVTINGTNNGTAHANLYLWNKDSEPLVIPAGTYKVGRTGHNGVQVLYYDGSKFGVLQSNTKDTITFASDTTLTQVYITIEKTVTTTFNNVTVYPIMVRDTDSIEPYEPHKLTTISLPLSDIQLRSTPDGTRDTFERVDGVWNKRNNVGEYVLDGTEDWGRSGGTTSTVFVGALTNDKLPMKTKVNNGIASHFTRNLYTIIGTFQFYNPDADGICTAFAIRLDITEVADVTALKTWLVSNPVTVQYVLATPTYTPITDPALISALDELEQLILHKGYNRITVTAVNGIKAYLDLSYIKDINIVLENLISRIGGAE